MNPATSSALLALLMIAPFHASFVTEISLSKAVLYQQSSATTVSRLPAKNYPYSFAAEVNGDTRAFTVSLSPKPKITLPTTSKFFEPYHQKPALGLDPASDGGWNFGYVGNESFGNWGTKTKAEFDSAFPNGNYIFTVQGRVINLSQPKDTYPPAPLILLKGGRWEGGEYHIAVSKILTINSGIYPKYGKTLNDYISLDLEDETSGEEIFGIAQVAKTLANGPKVSTSKSRSKTLAANSLEAGRLYYLSSSFGAIVGQSGAMPNCLSTATFGTETTVKIVAE